ELRTDPEALLDLIYQEIVLRAERGEALQPEEFRGRFPALGPRLDRLFEVHRALEGSLLGHATESRPSQAPRPAPDAGHPGVRLPGYDPRGERGRGARGVVYKARHRGLNRLVALKMILAGAHAGAAELARFRREAEAVARLQHPHIVQIHEIGEQEG